MRNRLFLGFLTVVLLLFGSNFVFDAFGQTPVFGPVKYIRETGKPQKITNTFSVQNPEGEFTLNVQNGEGQNGSVSSAVIELNGVRVVGPNEFNKQIDLITKSVSLQQQNEISVEVRSEPGTSIIVTVFGAEAPPLEPVEFDEGDDIPELTEFVPTTGGTLTVTDPISPIYGVVVDFPAGALPQSTEVTIGYNNGSLVPNSGTYSANILIEVPGIKEFSQPVEITVPFDQPNSIPIPYYITGDGSIRPCQLVKVDRINKTFTFQIFHASLFTWIVDIFTSEPDTLVDTGFEPNEDGFQVTNINASSYNREGECFGMTSFSLWYWMNHLADGDFYPRFYNVVGQDSNGDNLRGQDIIATRAFVSIAQQWNLYIPTVTREQGLTAQERYATIRNIIDNTMEPVLIYLWHETGTSTGAHSVLAFAYDGATGEISIYDPNFPGATRTIQYNLTSNEFNNYGGYDGIVYNGDGSLHLTEPYQNILDDAEDNFSNSSMPTINITSHANGSIVTERNIELIGSIDSVEILVSRLKVLVGSVEFTSNVAVNGNFSIPISLEGGVNHLVFSLEGEDSGGNLIAVSPTNLDTVDYTIELAQPNSIILMTLTWDKDDTDLDTYVIDPTGDYSCYYHMITSDGGELDYDDVDGFGPEHWTLMNTDTIRYDQPYRFRVHYYSDHGNGGTNYIVTIKLYEGTSREVTYSYTGYLSANVPSNDHPADTGPDWVDIAELTLTMGTSGSISLNFAPMTTSPMMFAPAAARTLTVPDEIIISVPVPSTEERMLLKANP